MRKSSLVMVLLVASPLLLLAGYLAGSLSLSGAEPKGLFVNCGPAVFGRPSPVPDPACSSAYAPLPQLTYVLLAAGFACAVVAVAILVGRRIRSAFLQRRLG
jgi:hypothetical protein